jgi:DNA polymerase-3 subunit alpha
MSETNRIDEGFVHLDVNTQYSLGKSVVRIDRLIELCEENKMPAVGVTDHNNLFSAFKAYKASQKQGIKLIIGSLISIKINNETDCSKLILLCENQTGYKNLCYLITKSYVDGFKSNEPFIDINWLEGKSDGLIAVSAYQDGVLNQIRTKDNQKLKNLINTMTNLFPNNFFIGIQRIGQPREEEFIDKMVSISTEHNIPLVATNNPRFLSKDDYISLEARVCIDQGRVLDDQSRHRDYTNQQFFKTSEEMKTLFEDLPEALINSIKIAKKCNFSFDNTDHVLPEFSTPDKYSIDDFLTMEANEGLLNLAKNQTIDKQIYDKRLIEELEIIKGTGFSGYFLIVADFVKWSREQNIPVGPGRGSGPGSLVAYCLGITDIDPIEHDLIFERFLNPERISMPDFDIDFCVNGRDAVIDYVSNKYGNNMVSQIITYGTLSAKAVIRDVGRILGYPYGLVDQVAKLVPFDIGITITEALKKSDELSERYKNDEDVESIINLSLKLEGLVRNAGTHAGGVIIAPSELSNFMPLYKVDDEVGTVTQFDKDDAESIGLIKFDFLGLKTLTVIQKSIDIINAYDRKNNKNTSKTLNIKDISLDDKKTYKLLSFARTVGIFQLESTGMRDLIKRMQPKKFDDIIALVALFRPGTLSSKQGEESVVDTFIKRRKQNNPDLIPYTHDLLMPILKDTYGCIVYQEQVMQIAQKLANFSQGRADILRKAMGKKDDDLMAEQKDGFVKGCISNKVEERAAKNIWSFIEKFAGYGFNKAHSVSYATIAYQTAWLKTHHTTEFFAASMTADIDNTDKLIRFKEDCESFKIEIKGPCVNHSSYEFFVEKENQIRYGLGAIKGLGQSISEAISEERRVNGKYHSIFDLCSRLSSEKISKRTIEALIKSGSLDDFSETRATLSDSIEMAISYSNRVSLEQQTGQTNLFYTESNQEESLPELKRCKEWKLNELLDEEFSSLGFYFSGHPFDPYRDDCKHLTKSNIATLKKMMETQKNANGYTQQESLIQIAGLITTLKRRGNNYTFKIDDGTAVMEGIIFGERKDYFREMLNNNSLLFLKGKLRFDSFADLWQFVAEDAVTIDSIVKKKAKMLLIKCDSEFNPSKLKKILKSHTPGTCEIQLNYETDINHTKLKLGKEWTVSPTRELRDELTVELGSANFQFVSH